MEPTPETNTPDTWSDSTQAWHQSRTVQAVVVALSPVIARWLGIDPGTLAPYLGDVITVVAGLCAIAFRIAATKIIR